MVSQIFQEQKKDAPTVGERPCKLYFNQLLVRGSVGQNVDPAAFLIELHRAIYQGEQREILATADIPAGVKYRSHLTNDDCAGSYRFAAKTLDTAPLALGVASIAAGSLTFLMRHLESSKCRIHRRVACGIILGNPQNYR